MQSRFGAVGVVSYDPADLTVTVAAGTSCGALSAILADAGRMRRVRG
jgi:FAD/FMN-containing dehydrogenase